jgi:hypothetical protein
MSTETEPSTDASLAEESPLRARADPAQLQLAEQVRRTWWFQPSAAATMEDVMRPEYWSRCVHRFSAGGADQPPDRIECMPADRRWFLELMVLEIGAEGVIVMRIAGGELPRYRLASKLRPIGENAEDYEFKNMGTLKWAVVRKHDGMVMTKGQPMSREECARWLAQYLQTVLRT